MTDKSYKDFSNDGLIEEMRKYPVDHLNYAELRGELERRLMARQLEAAEAHLKSAKWQILIVIAMYLTIAATLFAPYVAK